MAQIHDYEDVPSGHSERVELKVHGVGGTPPESMLDSLEIVRVRGDATAAIFRRKQRRVTEPYVQEAYSWGGLTSGSASRALWVFLAPFAFSTLRAGCFRGRQRTPRANRRRGSLQLPPICSDSSVSPSPSTRSSASLHLAGAGAALAWILAWTFAWLQPAGTSWFQLALGATGLALLLASGVSIAFVRDALPVTDESVSDNMQMLVRWHRWITAGVLLAVLLGGWLWPGYQDPSRTTALDPYGDIWRSIWIVSVVALIAFAFTVLSDPRRTRRIRAPISLDDSDAQVVVGFGSFGAVVAAFFGFLVAVAMLGGFGAATARLLGERPTILYSYLYDAFGFATTVWVIALFVAITLAWFVRRPQPVPGSQESMSPLVSRRIGVPSSRVSDENASGWSR